MITEKAFSIVFEYDEYIDVRFFSEFLFHIKAFSSYLRVFDEIYRYRFISFISKIDKNEIEISELAHSIIHFMDKFYRVYRYGYIDRYAYFKSREPKIKILKVKEGSIELLIAGISLSVLIISSAVAYKIIESKNVEFEIPKIIKVKINND